MTSTHPRRAVPMTAALVGVLVFATTCSRRPREVPAGYHEFTYVTGGKADTVSVIDLLQFRSVKTIPVGHNPTGIAANPKRNEIYAVNTESNNISVIDA